MSFTITDEDGNITKEIWSCTECVWLSTKCHCKSTEDDPTCVLCNSTCKKLGTQTETTGMPAHRYNTMLDWLQENRGGIGPAIISNIKEEFPEGDDFLEACENAYQNAEYDELTEVGGVGQGTARNKIARGLAELKDWDGGDAEPIETDTFTLSQ